MRHFTPVIFLLLALALTALAPALPALAAGSASPGPKSEQGTAPSLMAAAEALHSLWNSLPFAQLAGEPAGSGEEPDCDEDPSDPACCEEGSTEPQCRPPVYPFPDPNGVVDDPPPIP